MSSSAFAASITNATIATIYFNVAKTPNGRIADRLNRIYEELQAPGVDGRRWRLRNSVFPDFQMQTWADAADYGAAVIEARRYDLAFGQYVNLTWAAANFSPQPYVSVKVIACQPVCMPGSMGGFGVTGTTGSGIIMCQWTMAVLAQEGVTP